MEPGYFEEYDILKTSLSPILIDHFEPCCLIRILLVIILCSVSKYEICLSFE